MWKVRGVREVLIVFQNDFYAETANTEVVRYNLKGP